MHLWSVSSPSGSMEPMETTNNATPTSDQLTVVLGGNGKTGRRVADRLAAAGRPVRPVSRSTPIRFDWTDASTWPAALAGAASAYVTYQPDLAAPGSTDAIAALGKAAEQAGIERLVLLSGRGEPAAHECERILLDGPIATTVVACSFFAQNLSEHFLHGPVVDGVIALPAGDVAEPIVDADDVADVVVAALTEDGHTGRIYELTGPELLTFHDVAATLTKALDRDVVYLPVTTDDYVSEAVAAGLEADEAAMLAELFAHIFDGHNASLAGGVQEALGRPARSFAAFAADAAAAGAWSL